MQYALIHQPGNYLTTNQDRLSVSVCSSLTNTNPTVRWHRMQWFTNQLCDQPTCWSLPAWPGSHASTPEISETTRATIILSTLSTGSCSTAPGWPNTLSPWSSPTPPPSPIPKPISLATWNQQQLYKVRINEIRWAKVKYSRGPLCPGIPDHSYYRL